MTESTDISDAVAIQPGPDWTYGDGEKWVDATLQVVVADARLTRSERLNELFHKGTRAQWDVENDIDWSHQLQEENPLLMPDATIPIASTAVWAKLSEKEKIKLRREIQSWHISQILHGERASLLCASKLMLSATSQAVKECAAVQAMDEARHIHAYEKLLARLGPGYPVSPSLDRLLINILQAADPDITALGMQILVEGLALAFFKSLQLYSRDPLVRNLLQLVVRDEARHFAGGQLALAERHAQLSRSEIAYREEFVSDAFLLLQDYLFADEIWEPSGLPRQECVNLARTSPVTASMHRTLFRSLVPAVRAIGLLGGKTTATFERMGILGYAMLPV